MNTVTAQTMMDGAMVAIGWDLAQLEDRQRQMAREAFSLALQEVWEAWWWSELMQCAPATFTADYVSGWNYGQGDLVYWHVTDRYYIGLAPGLAPPSTQIGDPVLDSQGNPVPSATAYDNLGQWARWREDALERAPQWTAPMTPNTGDQVQWKGVLYQCVVDQGVLPITNAEPVDPPPAFNVVWIAVASFQPTAPFVAQIPNFTPPFGYIATPTGPFGPVRSVTREDPRNHPGTKGYRFEKTAKGTEIYGLDVGRPWVWARRPTPVITGDAFDATVTYSAAPAQNLCFDS